MAISCSRAKKGTQGAYDQQVILNKYRKVHVGCNGFSGAHEPHWDTWTYIHFWKVIKEIRIRVQSGGEEPPSDAKCHEVTTNVGDILRLKSIVGYASDTEQFQRVFPLVDWQRFRKYVSCLLVCHDVLDIKMPIIQEFLQRT